MMDYLKSLIEKARDWRLGSRFSKFVAAMVFTILLPLGPLLVLMVEQSNCTDPGNWTSIVFSFFGFGNNTCTIGRDWYLASGFYGFSIFTGTNTTLSATAGFGIGVYMVLKWGTSTIFDISDAWLFLATIIVFAGDWFIFAFIKEKNCLEGLFSLLKSNSP